MAKDSKKTRDIFLLLAAATTLLIGVMGWHWEDTADNPFWYSFWPWASISCDVLWVVVWAILWNRDKPRRR